MNAFNRRECREIYRYVLLLCSLFALAFLLGSSSPVYGQVNDYFVDAIAITSLPFTAQADISSATTESLEPSPLCSVYPPTKTVWYKFVPTTDTQIRADFNGMAQYDTFLSVWQGTNISSLSEVGCVSSGGRITFGVSADQTYYFQLGSNYSSGDLQLNLSEIQPPANDDFENASVIAGLPFDDTQDTTAATIQQDEPTPSCVTSNPVDATIWYAFTPAENMSISAYIANPAFGAFIAAYVRDENQGLSEIGCRPSYWGMLTFPAVAGVTYYFQTGGIYEQGLLVFTLQEAPPPIANFYFNPSDPNIFDTVQFYDGSSDPAGLSIASQSWDFGDGATAEGSSPTHRYSQDGDYTVKLAVSTSDGRTASTSQTVHVRTHDVAITKFTAPSAASSGQTRGITVGINSRLYPEKVTVQLQKGLPGSYYTVYEVIGMLTQSVPVRSANRTTNFSFSYTFTNDDATIGKVVFKAIVIISGARDALPADNEATAFPTKVSR